MDNPAPIVRHLDDLVPKLISPADTVRLATLVRPDDGADTSVFFEIWEPGGAQPSNSHPDSVETFLFLSGEGEAYCDDAISSVQAGQLLVLPPRSVHRIENTGPGRLYAITTMTPDAGFAALVRAGVPEPLDSEDLAVLSARFDRC